MTTTETQDSEVRHAHIMWRGQSCLLAQNPLPNLGQCYNSTTSEPTVKNSRKMLNSSDLYKAPKIEIVCARPNYMFRQVEGPYMYICV